MLNSSTQAVISGGASGLGLAVAQRVIECKGKVVILDINEEQGKQAIEQLGVNARFVKTDISNDASVSHGFSEAINFLDRIDLAVNCAGILGPGKVLGKKGPMTAEHFQNVVNINLVGAFIFTKTAASIMKNNAIDKRQEKGLIIHTASIAAFEGQLGQAAYSATKAGVIGMILPIAREFAALGIRIMAVAPGMFDTAMLEGVSDDIRADLCASVPFPARFGKPDEYAMMVEQIYDNQMLNGSVIRLDGAARLQ